MSNSHFDEKSGVICHEIDFGRWYQVRYSGFKLLILGTAVIYYIWGSQTKQKVLEKKMNSNE